jgi:hypothetical protein
MQINDNTVLSSFTLQTLYGSSLYAVEDIVGKQMANPEQVKSPKKIIIIVPEMMNDSKEGPGYIFLQGILQACKMDMSDVAIVSPGIDIVEYKKLTEVYDSSLVLMFGTTPGDISLPIYFPQFQLQEFSGVTYLSSPELTILENDKLLKSKLWLCLKQFFSL